MCGGFMGRQMKRVSNSSFSSIKISLSFLILVLPATVARWQYDHDECPPGHERKICTTQCTRPKATLKMVTDPAYYHCPYNNQNNALSFSGVFEDGSGGSNYVVLPSNYVCNYVLEMESDGLIEFSLQSFETNKYDDYLSIQTCTNFDMSRQLNWDSCENQQFGYEISGGKAGRWSGGTTDVVFGANGGRIDDIYSVQKTSSIESTRFVHFKFQVIPESTGGTGWKIEWATRPLDSICTKCDKGKYNPIYDSTWNRYGIIKDYAGEFCVDCAPNSYTSIVGAIESEECVCNSGYDKNRVNNYECSPCQTNAFSNGAGDICKCNPGYGYKKGDYSICEICPMNSYVYPDVMMECICNIGYQKGNSFQSGKECYACGIGRYKDNVNQYECVACGLGNLPMITSGLGSTSSNQCKCADNTQLIAGVCNCKAGYQIGHFFNLYDGTYMKQCLECPENFYKINIANNACVRCPTNSFSTLTGSTNINDCKCNLNYYKSGSVCQQCPTGSTTQGVGNTVVGDCNVCTTGYSVIAPSCTTCTRGHILGTEYEYMSFEYSGSAITMEHIVDFGENVECDILIVAGGGGGCSQNAGGGGAGGIVLIENFEISAGIYEISIGKGGNGANLGVGTNGKDSMFKSSVGGVVIKANGGGRGGGGSGNRRYGWAPPTSGGSGGGGGWHSGNKPGAVQSQRSQTQTGIPSSATLSQYGENGGNAGPNFEGGGGGGAGSVGQTPTRNGHGVHGGHGKDFTSFFGNTVGDSGWFGGGGGSGGSSVDGYGNGGASKFGGGGNGDNVGDGIDGKSNTGGGGGASRLPHNYAGRGVAGGGMKSGKGGSGIVIIRYKFKCDMCNAGKYKSIPGSSDCIDCPTGKFSNIFGATTSDICIQCDINSYYSSDHAKCISCPENSQSVLSSNLGSIQGTDKLSDCQCLPGFFGALSTDAVSTRVKELTNQDAWRLVRYLPAGAANWHPVEDNLEGTVVYNNESPVFGQTHTSGAWSVEFGAFDEFFFCNMAMDKWVYALKSEFPGTEGSGKVSRQILKSNYHDSAVNIDITYRSRISGPCDPFITDRSAGDGAYLLYAEDSETIADSYRSGNYISETGSMVFVRDSRLGLVKALTNEDGWRLVRFLPAGAVKWHPVNDNLEGTVAYSDASGAWGVLFGTFDEFFICNVAMSKWTRFSASTFVSEGNGYSHIPVIAHEGGGSQITAGTCKWLMRWTDTTWGGPDPMLNECDHDTNNLLYVEGSHYHARYPAGGGSMVFVRDSRPGRVETLDENEKICVGCIAGKYKVLHNDGQCTSCESGKYSSATNVATNLCDICPDHSNSPESSSLRTQCICNSGYTGTDGGECVACVSGKYKALSGSVQCNSCLGIMEPGAKSDVGSTEKNKCNCIGPAYFESSDDYGFFSCWCSAGYFRGDNDKCEECGVGNICTGETPYQYILPNIDVIPDTNYRQTQNDNNDMPRSIMIIACGVGKTTMTTTSTECVCDIGYTAAPILSASRRLSQPMQCTQCNHGKYKNVKGATLCTDCDGTGVTTLSKGSVARINCECAEGYDNLDNDNCKFCDIGMYKSNIGSENCSSCVPDSSTSNVAQTTIQNCICNPGYGGVAYSENGCVLCVVGKYKTDLENGVCLNVPENSSSSNDRTDYLCNFGFYRSNDAICETCGHLRYKDILGNNETDCLTCKSNSITLLEISTSKDDCLCYAGFESIDDNMISTVTDILDDTCEQCDSGSYKAETKNLHCTLNPPNSISTINRHTFSCIEGYFKEGSQCTPCALGFYKSSIKPGDKCIHCGNSYTTLKTASISWSDDCVCKNGYYYDNLLHICKECPLFMPSRSSDAFVCFYDGISETPYCDTDSVALEPCFCNIGTYLSDMGDCAVCPEQHYCSGRTQSNTQLTAQKCPVNTQVLLEGDGISLLSCICLDGFFRMDTIMSPDMKLQLDYKITKITKFCEKCPRGFYCFNEILTGFTTIQKCMDSSISIGTGASSILDCNCIAGSYRIGFDSNTFECIICPSNHFCPGGMSDIVKCGINTVSHIGSINNDDCICHKPFITIPSTTNILTTNCIIQNSHISNDNNNILESFSVDLILSIQMSVSNFDQHKKNILKHCISTITNVLMIDITLNEVLSNNDRRLLLSNIVVNVIINVVDRIQAEYILQQLSVDSIQFELSKNQIQLSDIVDSHITSRVQEIPVFDVYPVDMTRINTFFEDNQTISCVHLELFSQYECERDINVGMYNDTSAFVFMRNLLIDPIFLDIILVIFKGAYFKSILYSFESIMWLDGHMLLESLYLQTKLHAINITHTVSTGFQCDVLIDSTIPPYMQWYMSDKHNISNLRTYLHKKLEKSGVQNMDFSAKPSFVTLYKENSWEDENILPSALRCLVDDKKEIPEYHIGTFNKRGYFSDVMQIGISITIFDVFCPTEIQTMCMYKFIGILEQPIDCTSKLNILYTGDEDVSTLVDIFENDVNIGIQSTICSPIIFSRQFVSSEFYETIWYVRREIEKVRNLYKEIDILLDLGASTLSVYNIDVLVEVEKESDLLISTKYQHLNTTSSYEFTRFFEIMNVHIVKEFLTRNSNMQLSHVNTNDFMTCTVIGYIPTIIDIENALNGMLYTMDSGNENTRANVSVVEFSRTVTGTLLFRNLTADDANIILTGGVERRVEVLSEKDGWRLVRFMPVMGSQVEYKSHSATDNLRGTSVYDYRDEITDLTLSTNRAGSWSVEFGDFDEYFISNYAIDKWVYFTKNALDETHCDDTNYARACGIGQNEACPTQQSSLYQTRGPDLAVDGNINQNSKAGSCSHTWKSSNTEWWMVDLEKHVTVSGLDIFGRGDCCHGRSVGYTVYVGNDNTITSGHKNEVCVTVGSNVGLPRSGAEEITCTRPIYGRYIFFTLTNHIDINFVELCEVKVWSKGSRCSTTGSTILHVLKSSGSGINDGVDSFSISNRPQRAALNETLCDNTNYARACGIGQDEACPTQQSSMFDQLVSDLAVDGNTNQNSHFGSCSHTSKSSNTEWWMVDLEKHVTVSGLDIFGRSDCCHGRSVGYTVYVGNDNTITSGHKNEVCVTVGSNVGLPRSGAEEITCTRPIYGRYIFFTLTNHIDINFVELCEVKVWSTCVDSFSISNRPQQAQDPTIQYQRHENSADEHDDINDFIYSEGFSDHTPSVARFGSMVFVRNSTKIAHKGENISNDVSVTKIMKQQILVPSNLSSSVLSHITDDVVYHDLQISLKTNMAIQNLNTFILQLMKGIIFKEDILTRVKIKSVLVSDETESEVLFSIPVSIFENCDMEIYINSDEYYLELMNVMKTIYEDDIIIEFRSWCLVTWYSSTQHKWPADSLHLYSCVNETQAIPSNIIRYESICTFDFDIPVDEVFSNNKTQTEIFVNLQQQTRKAVNDLEIKNIFILDVLGISQSEFITFFNNFYSVLDQQNSYNTVATSMTNKMYGIEKNECMENTANILLNCRTDMYFNILNNMCLLFESHNTQIDIETFKYSLLRWVPNSRLLSNIDVDEKLFAHIDDFPCSGDFANHLSQMIDINISHHTSVKSVLEITTRPPFIDANMTAHAINFIQIQTAEYLVLNSITHTVSITVGLLVKGDISDFALNMMAPFLALYLKKFLKPEVVVDISQITTIRSYSPSFPNNLFHVNSYFNPIYVALNIKNMDACEDVQFILNEGITSFPFADVTIEIEVLNSEDSHVICTTEIVVVSERDSNSMKLIELNSKPLIGIGNGVIELLQETVLDLNMHSCNAKISTSESELFFNALSLISMHVSPIHFKFSHDIKVCGIDTRLMDTAILNKFIPASGIVFVCFILYTILSMSVEQQRQLCSIKLETRT